MLIIVREIFLGNHGLQKPEDSIQSVLQVSRMKAVLFSAGGGRVVYLEKSRS